jgi:riboflavin synthase
MFTGIVTAVGVVQRRVRSVAGTLLTIAVSWDDLTLGESVSVAGACLTVMQIEPGAFSVQVVATSLERTIAGAWERGRRVNLERALRCGDRFGGHLVQGHVDGVGEVIGRLDREGGRLLDIRVHAAVAAVSIPLGSLTVDGVSLTVNAMPAPDVLQVSLIPFTLDHTTLGERVVADRVHLEGDLVGKYLTQLARPWTGHSAG